MALARGVDTVDTAMEGSHENEEGAGAPAGR